MNGCANCDGLRTEGRALDDRGMHVLREVVRSASGCFAT